VSDAQSHPHFVYRPETGEELYHSLMGVPIIRDGRVLGVLVVQNKTHRHYTDEEIETLETVAMVLAELIMTSRLLPPQDPLSTSVNPAFGVASYDGVKIHGGLGSGIAVCHTQLVTLDHMVADNPDDEIARLQQALSVMHQSLEQLVATTPIEQHHDSSAIVETYQMFAKDKGWIERMKEAIRSGLTAEAAVQRVQQDTKRRMQEIPDPYLRERLHDFEDVTHRLLQCLTGYQRHYPQGQDIILVARSMGPVELLDYDVQHVKGVVLEEGSATSHVAIIARTLNIPMIGRVRGIVEQVQDNDPLILDADDGRVYVRPSEDIQAKYTESMKKRALRRKAYLKQRHLPALSKDGVKVDVLVNAGFVADVHAMHEVGAEGIGLYRTEIPFMVRHDFPDVDTQVDLYRKVLEAAGDKPVVFRTLDIGGDKHLPYLHHHDREDENPAMGWRAIRIGLDRPVMLRHQLRAMLRAAAGRAISIMFPMVSTVQELLQAREILQLEQKRQANMGLTLPTQVQVGVMVEVPALLWQIPTLAKYVDFMSVGSNDLLQFFFACDRSSPRVAERYDALSPAVMAMVKSLSYKCNKAGIPLTVCGELASQPLAAMMLVALGVRRLSMAPYAIGEVKATIRSLDVGNCNGYVKSLLKVPNHSIREKLRVYAHDHNVKSI
jgi:phosphotransferase system enzyme I (PtsP)